MPFPGDLDKQGGPAKQLKYEGPSIGWVNNYNANPDAAGMTLQVPTTDGAGHLTFGAGGGGASTFNVMTYGATGGGVVDDTTAINAAIAALNATPGGRLYFPAGTYLTNSGTFTTVGVPCVIYGD